MSNETRISYYSLDTQSYRRAVAKLFSGKNLPPRASEAGIRRIVSSRRIIRTTYTRHDPPPLAIALPLKQ